MQHGFRHSYLQNVAAASGNVYGHFAHAAAERCARGKYRRTDHAFVAGDEEEMSERAFMSVGRAVFPLFDEPLARDDLRVTCIHAAKIRILSGFSCVCCVYFVFGGESFAMGARMGEGQAGSGEKGGEEEAKMWHRE